MTYELRKQLKDAGFPCRFTQDCDCWPNPTLSELIEACGEDFKEVRNFKNELVWLYGKTTAAQFIKKFHDGLKDGEWVAESTRTWTSDEGTTSCVSSNGQTPEEAVAKLWIALHAR